MTKRKKNRDSFINYYIITIVIKTRMVNETTIYFCCNSDKIEKGIDREHNIIMYI